MCEIVTADRIAASLSIKLSQLAAYLCVKL
jgi:hypothetical protein